MRVVVVGAGLSGLAAARRLAADGTDVLVIDKGRSPGGRLATRRIGGAVLDHGAQFFTTRTDSFARQVDDWLERDVVRVWSHGFGPAADGHPRFVATAGMNSLAKDLARGLDVECSTMAFSVRPASGAHRWEVVIDDGSVRAADAVVVTCPLPQSFSLLVDSGIPHDEAPFRTDYDRTMGLLAVLEGPGAVPPPGGLQEPDDGATFTFVGDNRAKGVSPVPAITCHANPEWSEAHWDDDPEVALDALQAAAAEWIGDATVVERQLKKWRFATPRTIWPEPCWTSGDGSVVLAGDAFAGPRVEGAHNSGLAAADVLLA